MDTQQHRIPTCSPQRQRWHSSAYLRAPASTPPRLPVRGAGSLRRRITISGQAQPDVSLTASTLLTDGDRAARRSKWHIGSRLDWPRSTPDRGRVRLRARRCAPREVGSDSIAVRAVLTHRFGPTAGDAPRRFQLPVLGARHCDTPPSSAACRPTQHFAGCPAALLVSRCDSTVGTTRAPGVAVEILSKASVSAAPHVRSLRHDAGVSGTAERRGVGTASATDPSRRAMHSAIQAFVRALWRATRAENPARRARGPEPCWLPSKRMSRKGHSRMCVRPVSHGAPSPRHTAERVARDTPRARRCETPAQRVVGVRLQRTARLSPPSKSESLSMNDEQQVPQAGTPAAAADGERTPVERLEALGVRGILWQLARDGQIIDVRCEMPQCYCFRGRRYFQPRSPGADWMLTADHYPRLKMHGGHLTPDNVRLAHRLCNQRDYLWRMKINAMLGKRMSLKEIAEKLNAEKVPTIHGTNRWTAASVRKAFVS